MSDTDSDFDSEEEIEKLKEKLKKYKTDIKDLKQRVTSVENKISGNSQKTMAHKVKDSKTERDKEVKESKYQSRSQLPEPEPVEEEYESPVCAKHSCEGCVGQKDWKTVWEIEKRLAADLFAYVNSINGNIASRVDNQQLTIAQWFKTLAEAVQILK